MNSIFQRDLSLICVFLSSSMFLFSQIFFIDLYFSCCFSFKFCVFLLFRECNFCILIVPSHSRWNLLFRECYGAGATEWTVCLLFRYIPSRGHEPT